MKFLDYEVVVLALSLQHDGAATLLEVDRAHFLVDFNVNFWHLKRTPDLVARRRLADVVLPPTVRGVRRSSGRGNRRGVSCGAGRTGRTRRFRPEWLEGRFSSASLDRD